MPRHAGTLTGGACAHETASARARLVVTWAVECAGGPADLRVEVTGGTATATLHVAGVPSRVLSEPAPVTVTLDHALGLEHIGALGVLRLTRAGDRLLYAQTPLLARAGVAGGRAERPRVRTDV